MATAAEFVAVAASQIGTRENPKNSNKQKYGEWYGMNGQPWCAMFVSWCSDQVGALSITGQYAYCPSWVNYAKQQGRWLDRSAKPQPGDIVFFSNGKRACHVGIVEVRNGTESVTTIEGNTSTTSNDNGGAVMRRTRKYGKVGSSWYIMGFFRPAWDGTASGGSTQSTTTASSGSLAVDGTWGKATTKAVQKVLGTSVDGIVSHQNKARKASCPGLSSSSWQWETSPTGGSDMVRALQRKIGVSVDGRAGKQTITALQEYLGTTQDGKVSKPSQMVKELQRRLNAGTI